MSIELKENEAIDDLQCNGLKIIQNNKLAKIIKDKNIYLWIKRFT